MKWPLVWRSTLDAEREFRREGVRQSNDVNMENMASCARALDHRDEVIRRLETTAEREAIRSEARYADLMVSYRMLRLQGFTPAPAEPVARPEEKPDPVMAAINAVARDAKTRAAAIRQVEIDRAAKLTDVEIIQRIHRGNRPAEETT